MNTSKVADNETARTCPDAAMQRAENLAIMGCKNVLELCVGPSLSVLQQSYRSYGIRCSGNDIQHRWSAYYRKGTWLIGDCLQVPYEGFDCIVFAPPLSKGCTGRREDALPIDSVFPRYQDFLTRVRTQEVDFVLVLPARSWATRQDRTQFHSLMNSLQLNGLSPEPVAITSGRRKITKYIDVYVRNS
jgi:hypothetical protein